MLKNYFLAEFQFYFGKLPELLTNNRVFNCVVLLVNFKQIKFQFKLLSVLREFGRDDHKVTHHLHFQLSLGTFCSGGSRQ